MARLPNPELVERRKREILEAALACFRRSGFHKASMQEICREAKISPGALYRYFPSKADIIAAIAEADSDAYGDRFTNAPPGQPLSVTIAEVFGAALEQTMEYGGGLIADVIAEASRNDELAERLRQNELIRRLQLTRLIEQAQACGEIDRNLEPEAAAEILQAFFDGVLLRVAVFERAYDRDTTGDVVRTFLQRLLASPALAPNRHAERAAP